MKQIFLIAWREYKQYVFSRGFLLFLIMFPLGLVFIGGAMGLLEKNKPTRYFVVFDETGAYSAEIDQEIERRYKYGAIGAWDFYVGLNVEPAALLDGPIGAPFAPDDITESRVQKFSNAGGFEAAQAAVAPHLKPGAGAFVMPKRSFRRLALPEEAARASDIASAEEVLRPYLLAERSIDAGDDGARPLFAAVLIPAGFGLEENSPPAQYWSRNLTDPGLEMTIAGALNRAFRRTVIADFGLPQEAFDEVAAVSAPMASFRPDRSPDEAELGIQDRIETALPAGLTYMLLTIIFGVGNLLLTNTIEERSNKIVEILLSSVTANQLMMGKLAGIAAVGLTMPLIFLLGGVGLALFSGGGEENIVAIAVGTLFSTNILLIYLFYFLCAYLIFSMIFLAIGAVSNSLQDAQSYMGPVMLLVFAPLPFMVLVFQNPNGLVASILTWIPIYTPYAVMMRAAADPPLWEILGATAVMLVFAFFLMRIMGRVFRQAILQASPPKMREVWRLARREQA